MERSEERRDGRNEIPAGVDGNKIYWGSAEVT